MAYNAMNILSEQIETLTNALQNNMTPEDNENSETRTIGFESGREYEIDLQEIKGKPSEVRILDSALFEKADLSWEVMDQKRIKVKVDWESRPAAPINATLLIRGASDAAHT